MAEKELPELLSTDKKAELDRPLTTEEAAESDIDLEMYLLEGGDLKPQSGLETQPESEPTVQPEPAPFSEHKPDYAELAPEADEDEEPQSESKLIAQSEPALLSEPEPQSEAKRWPNSPLENSVFANAYIEIEHEDESIKFATGSELKSNPKKKRAIDYTNHFIALEIIKTKNFKSFRSFLSDLTNIEEKIKCGCTGKERQEIKEKEFARINKEMKNKDDVLYKKLLTKMYDSDPKQKKFKNVKIRKVLIEQLQKEFLSSTAVIEQIVELALSDYLKIRKEYNK